MNVLACTQVYAVDHGTPLLTGTTTVYVLVEGSHTPVFDPHVYYFSVRDSQSALVAFCFFADRFNVVVIIFI